MTLLLKQIEGVDPRTKDIVFGYIHRKERKLKLTHIPELIAFTCLLFYNIPEYFKYAAKTIKLDQYNRLIKQNGLGFGTAYGKMEIHPADKKVYTWKFRIIHERGINIGIASDILHEDGDFAGQTDHDNYAYCQSGKKYSHRIKDGAKFMNPFREGDIVWMRLDFCIGNGTLAFKQNVNAKWWCAFNSIGKFNQRLRIAVSLYRKSSVQLLSVEVK